MKIKIDKNIPIPRRRSGSGATGMAEALRSLKVMESFSVPVSLKASIAPMARYVGVKIASRIDGKGNVRVWRIK